MSGEVELEVLNLRGHKAGKIIKCLVDVDGVIKDRFWRRRLRDSVRDNCVRLVVAAAVEVVTEIAEKQRKKREVTDNGNSNS